MRVALLMECDRCGVRYAGRAITTGGLRPSMELMQLIVSGIADCPSCQLTDLPPAVRRAFAEERQRADGHLALDGSPSLRGLPS